MRRREDVATEEAKKKGMFKELWGYRNFRTCFFLAMTHMSGYYIIQIYASLLLEQRSAGISVQTAGLLISAAGFAGIFWSIFLPKLSDNFGRRTILAISYIAAILVPLSIVAHAGSRCFDGALCCVFQHTGCCRHILDKPPSLWNHCRRTSHPPESRSLCPWVNS